MWIFPPEIAKRRQPKPISSLLSRLLACSPSAHWIFDRRANRLLYASASAEQFLGSQPATTFQHPSVLVKRVDRRDRHRFLDLLRCASRGEKAHTEVRMRRHDGAERWVAIMAQALPPGNDGLKLIGGAVEDISKSRKSMLRLTRAERAARRASSEKSDMLAATSHEIRNSLGAMLGYVELLERRREMTEDTYGEYLEIIMRNGERLSHIINDVLDLSKAEAGMLAFESRPFNPADILHNVVALFRHAAEAKGITLEVKLADDVPILIESDAKRMQQVLVNIVGNAVKFTEHGGIKIQVDYLPAPTAQLVVTVKDTGPGIAGVECRNVFKAFHQVGGSKAQGTGLGLSLALRLARGLGGDVVLESSSPESGSVFKVTVPAGPSALGRLEPPKGAAPRRGSRFGVAGVKILVVDDASDNRLLLKRLLEAAGATVETAENGLEGLRLAGDCAYDVVLMDIEMPVLDGLAATKELRRRGYRRPIVALTAHAMQRDLEACLRSGCDDHIIKPVSQESLLAKIAAFAKQTTKDYRNPSE